MSNLFLPPRPLEFFKIVLKRSFLVLAILLLAFGFSFNQLKSQENETNKKNANIDSIEVKEEKLRINNCEPISTKSLETIKATTPFAQNSGIEVPLKTIMGVYHGWGFSFSYKL